MGVCPAERQLADGDNVMNLRTVPAVTSVLNVAASNGLSRFAPRFAGRQREDGATICHQPPAMRLEDILNRLLQEKRT